MKHFVTPSLVERKDQLTFLSYFAMIQLINSTVLARLLFSALAGGVEKI